MNQRTLFRWLPLYRQGGWGKLDPRKRGGRPRKLDGRALRWLYNTITGKSPLQLQFPLALWTAAMVQILIAERYGVRLSHSSVCRLLHQLGLSAQRPLWQAYQQNPEAVGRWVAEEYPAIHCQALRQRANEAGVRSDFHSGTTWGRHGQTPAVSSNRGALRRQSDLGRERARPVAVHSDPDEVLSARTGTSTHAPLRPD